MGAPTYPNDIFQHGRFSGGLRAYYYLGLGQRWLKSNALEGIAGDGYNLRQVQGVIANSVEDQILQFVDDAE